MSRHITAKPQKLSTLTITPVRKGLLQRKCACGQHAAAGSECAECQKQRMGLQRRSISLSPYQGDGRGKSQLAPPIVQDALRSSGQPLDQGTRAFMEPHFGRDFSQVRVHTDSKAAESAQAVNAHAYTAGRHIVFSPGQYAPKTSVGQSLLAHELTHVVQQEAFKTKGPGEFELGPTDGPFERQAQRTTASLTGVSLPSVITGAPKSLLQRQPITQPGSPVPGIGLPGMGQISLPAESVELGASESISKKNPKLVRIALSFKSLRAASPDAHIELSSQLTSAAKMSSEKAAKERARLGDRAAAARDALQSLGIPKDKISIEPPTAFSTSARGQISVEVYKARSFSPFLLPPSPGSTLGPTAPSKPKTAPGLAGLSDLLTLKFGPLTIELPKSAALKLPIPIASGKKLVIDLKAETSGTFSLSITLDGTSYVRVSLKAGVTYEKEKGATGSAGLQIEMTRTICHAANPESLKAKINKAGKDLKKAMQDYSAELDSDKKLMKLADIGSALGEMYEAVDKSKSACKKVPAAKFEFGVKGPLGGETDPSKRGPGYIGGTITIPF